MTEPPSTFATDAMRAGLKDMRRSLLDLSKRNPLIHTPVSRSNAKQILIVDELSDEILRMLNDESKTFTFLPKEAQETDADEEDANVEDIFVPEELANEVHARHTDTKLQTELTPEALQKKLLALFREARTIEEELSVSVLFLALGFLHYYDSDSSEVDRYAPLLLIPVALARRSSASMFSLAPRDEDLVSNQNLAQMLQQEHGVLLPDLPNMSPWRATDYFDAVRQVIQHKARWEVEPNRMVLRFYSFERFMMSHDLEDEVVAKYGESDGESLKLVHQLLGGEVGSAGVGAGSTGLSVVETSTNLDARFDDPKELGHILDADTSQTQVVAAALSGRNLVVQGPPGTGKSQTIANIIALAANRGKRVLFIAEKKAALDVVHQRLERSGLDRLCLELHSHKANRKQVYESLRRALNEQVAVSVNEDLYAQIRATRDELNHINALIHTVDPVTGNSPYLIMGRIAQLSGRKVPAPAFQIEDIETWSKDTFESRRDMLARWVDLIEEFGFAAKHPFRGVRKRLSPLERERLLNNVQSNVLLINELAETIDVRWHGPDAKSERTLGWYQDHLRQLQALQALPTNAPSLLTRDSVKDEHRTDLLNLMGDIATYQAMQTELGSQVLDSAFEKSWVRELALVTQRGASFWRFLNRPFRSAIASLKEVSKAALAKSQKERIELLEKLVQLAEIRRKVDTREALGRAHFDLSWADVSTSVETDVANVTWIHDQAPLFRSIEGLAKAIETSSEFEDFDDYVVRVEAKLGAWWTSWRAIVDETDLEQVSAFDAEDDTGLALSQIRERILEWAANMDSLVDYHAVRAIEEELARIELQPLVDCVNNGALTPSVAVDSLLLHRCETIYKKLCKTHPELEEISGAERSKLVERFKDLDKTLKQLAVHETLIKHDERMPKGSVGAMGIIRGEMNKKRSHMAIRQLLDAAGEAVALIKPVFLMSPISVSRYLTPGKLTFDLLLMDEASQIKPEEAIGAMMRTKQVVVVGDQKQMPPSSFFDKQVLDMEDEVDDEDLSAEEIRRRQTVHMESVLSLCEARGFDQAMLSWHYRSEHPSLIEVSNHEFYDSNLIYPPSPDFGLGNSGLTFVKVDGVYERSRGRFNRDEGDAICARILEHVRNYPGRSLGVVALSVAQRNLLQNMVDDLCREHPDVERYCNEQNDEPFFVKNLENVQGDERDIIYISIGYGPDADGYFGQNFGPVSSEGGERRLNVLFTRARKQCAIFASITHDVIRTDAAQHQGPRVLKQFLRYAETGTMDVPLITGKEMDSPFEADVAQVLADAGYRVEAQVGSSGFKIDLAVHDPDNEGHFLLAVECDGARYHSSSWARERDRLRQEVLEGKGWRFHRIWSTDWFQAREREIHRLLDAIEVAKTTPSASRENDKKSNEKSSETDSAADTGPPIVTVERSDAPVIPTQPYAECTIELGTLYAELNLADAHPEFLRDMVNAVVKTEEPVHVEVVMRKLVNTWGLSRIGSRIRANLEYCFDWLCRDGAVLRSAEEGQFLCVSSTSPTATLRDRSTCSLSHYLDPTFVPVSELHLALKRLVNVNMALSIDDCAREIVRLLGVKRNRAALLERLRKEAKTLARLGEIEFVDETLSRVESR